MTGEQDRTAEPEAPRGRSRRSVGQTVKLICVGLAVAVVLALAVQNQAPTETRFLVWSAEMPRFALLGIVYLIGVVSGWAVRGRRRRRGR